MKSIVAAVATALAVLAAPAAGSAATLAFEPAKACYREFEAVSVVAMGFTPGGQVDVSRDGTHIGTLPADAAGNASGGLNGLPSKERGQQAFTYTATDKANPLFTASLPVLVSAVDVRVGPRTGAPSRMLTINVRGFTTGRTMWAHVVRGRTFKRHLKLGRLRGACHKLRVERRLLRPGTAVGRYTVQFDTFRRYRPRRPVSVDFSVTVFTRTASAAAAAAARTLSWVRSG
jgi:hypothetical protein